MVIFNLELENLKKLLSLILQILNLDMGDGRFSPNRGQFGSRGNINRGNIGNIGFRGGWLFFF